MPVFPKNLGVRAGSVVVHPLSVVLLVVSIATPGLAGPVCTLVMEPLGSAPVIGNKCETRVSPSSTFDIALSLMGFDPGLLTAPDSATWPNGTDNFVTVVDGRAPTTPRTWLRNSDVWYSQELTKALGSARLQQYVDNIYFGNRDLAGDAGKNNGLTQAWLPSSLQISPGEKTIASMPVFPAGGGWTVRGVTGTGFQRMADGARDRNRQFGWFVGWADPTNVAGYPL